MELAYQKALKLIDEVGCNHDLGNGDVTFKRAGSGYVAEAAYTILKQHCKLNSSCDAEDWINGPPRSQAGSWVWFRGRGVAPTRTEATDLAKGEAINHLTSECQIPHRQTKFHEFCEDFSQNNFVVYARASLEHRFCNEAKNSGAEVWEKLASPELADYLARYRFRKR